MPNRIIYETITTSETLAALSDQAERLWHRLTVVADDYGRFDARPDVVRSRCFPLRLDDWPAARVTSALREIEAVAAGDFLLYEVEGKTYGCFTKWPDWQRTRARASKFPPPLADARDGVRMSDIGERLSDTRGSRDDSRLSSPDSSSPRLSTAEIAAAFDAFWSAYPRRVEKQGAKRKFETLVRAGVDPAAIVAGAERYRDDTDRKPEFTKHPTTWLNNGCWEDEPGETEADRTLKLIRERRKDVG